VIEIPRATSSTIKLLVTSHSLIYFPSSLPSILLAFRKPVYVLQPNLVFLYQLMRCERVLGESVAGAEVLTKESCGGPPQSKGLGTDV